MSDQKLTVLQYGELVTAALDKLFSSMFEAEVRPRGEFSADLLSGGAAAAVVSLVGDVELSIWLGFPRQTALRIVEVFAGEALPFEGEDMADALGELANIVAGNTKSRLYAMGIKTQLSLPSVIMASDLRIFSQRDIPSRRIRFTSEWGDFWTEVVAGIKVGETRRAGA